MDSTYIITRLRNTMYKFPVAKALRARVQNLDESTKVRLLSNLKTELCKERNLDIYEPLSEIVQYRRTA